MTDRVLVASSWIGDAPVCLRLQFQPAADAQSPAWSNLLALTESSLNDFEEMSGVALLDHGLRESIHAASKLTTSLHGSRQAHRSKDPVGIGAYLVCRYDRVMPAGTQYVQDGSRQSVLMNVAEQWATTITGCLGMKPSRKQEPPSGNDKNSDSVSCSCSNPKGHGWGMSFFRTKALSGKSAARLTNESIVVTKLMAPFRRSDTLVRVGIPSRLGLDKKYQL